MNEAFMVFGILGLAFNIVTRLVHALTFVVAIRLMSVQLYECSHCCYLQETVNYSTPRPFITIRRLRIFATLLVVSLVAYIPCILYVDASGYYPLPIVRALFMCMGTAIPTPSWTHDFGARH